MGNAFFKPPVIRQAVKKSESYDVIHVGGEQFHAAAVALVNHIKHTAPLNEEAAKKIWNVFNQYFPKYTKALPPYLSSAAERIKLLIDSNKGQQSEFVESTAYVLRRIAVDEILRDYLNLNYRNVFASLQPHTPKSYLYDPQVVLPPSALKALAHVLDLPVTLSYKEKGKELRKREGVVAKGQLALQIQIQGDTYYPAVKNKNDFPYVGQLAITAKPTIHQEVEGTMAEVFAAIEADDQRLKEMVEHMRQPILSMIHAGELEYQQLRGVFTALLPLVPTNEAYIMSLLDDGAPVRPRDTELQKMEDITNILVCWAVEGVISKAQLFQCIENNQAYTPGIRV